MKKIKEAMERYLEITEIDGPIEGCTVTAVITVAVIAILLLSLGYLG